MVVGGGVFVSLLYNKTKNFAQQNNGKKMRRQFNPKLLVGSWSPEKNKTFDKIDKKEEKKKGKAVKAVQNNGWNVFYKKHRLPNMKIKEFALETGIHAYTISRWDKGTGSPTFRLLFSFLEYVADRDKKSVASVFDELYDCVEQYGTEEYK